MTFDKTGPEAPGNIFTTGYPIETPRAKKSEQVLDV
jgi:hypothetical protein